MSANGDRVLVGGCWSRRYGRKLPTVMMFLGQRGRCYLCGGRMTLRVGLSCTATVDHVVPRSRLRHVRVHGRNRRLACARCDGRKGNMTPAEYRAATFVRKWRD